MSGGTKFKGKMQGSLGNANVHLLPVVIVILFAVSLPGRKSPDRDPSLGVIPHL